MSRVGLFLVPLCKTEEETTRTPFFQHAQKLSFYVIVHEHTHLLFLPRAVMKKGATLMQKPQEKPDFTPFF